MIQKVRHRLGYLISRVRSARVSRIVSIAQRVSGVARRPTLFVIVDMLYCSVRYECAFQDYQDWDFALLSALERRTFMTHPLSDHIVRRYNTGEDRHVLSDKTRFNSRFGEYIGREWIDLRVASDAELSRFMARHNHAMAKVPDGLGGIGITKIATEQFVSAADLRANLMSQRQFLLEEFVLQHPVMGGLNTSSVNTLRIVTFVKDGTVHILARVLKIGRAGDVDNFSAGGMYTMLDEGGVALYPAFDGHDFIHPVHPLSGVSIVGFQVPHFGESIDLASRAALEVTDVPYVGWDIAVTPDGPLIIEANYNTGVFQAKPRASVSPQGLRLVYAAVADF